MFALAGHGPFTPEKHSAHWLCASAWNSEKSLAANGAALYAGQASTQLTHVFMITLSCMLWAELDDLRKEGLCA